MTQAFSRLWRRGEPVIEKLIVGLGNPGRKYAGNRHNIGFQCLDRLAEAWGLSFSRRKHKALLAQGEIAGLKVILAKPQTFMNLSGDAVERLARFYKLPPENILVIYDDLDLPLGRVRLRPEGGSGGHKGMKSIVEHLGTNGFPRLRVGIGRPTHGDPVDYVLDDFAPDEQIAIEEAYERVVSTVELWLTEGIATAMNRYNLSP
ncbi:MAG: aminoacyl-tRNA hydrolase [Anaerolineales bacterium]|nr:aminoacyl-tRNA hydrolase [Anaerolineales bacterium]